MLALRLPLALLVLLACAGCASDKSETLVGVDRRSYETLVLPQRRALTLPPRYNLDADKHSGTRPGASLSSSISVESLQRKHSAQGEDAAFLNRLGSTPDPDIRRTLPETLKAPVPISESLLQELLDR